MHNSVQVELDVTSKSRVDEWHQRRVTDQSKDAALSIAQAQVVKLTASKAWTQDEVGRVEIKGKFI